MAVPASGAGAEIAMTTDPFRSRAAERRAPLADRGLPRAWHAS
jgi:hypothetical protein